LEEILEEINISEIKFFYRKIYISVILVIRFTST
jgi:hypothetical protein